MNAFSWALNETSDNFLSAVGGQAQTPLVLAPLLFPCAPRRGFLFVYNTGFVCLFVFNLSKMARKGGKAKEEKTRLRFSITAFCKQVCVNERQSRAVWLRAPGRILSPTKGGIFPKQDIGEFFVLTSLPAKNE